MGFIFLLKSEILQHYDIQVNPIAVGSKIYQLSVDEFPVKRLHLPSATLAMA